MLGRYFKGMPYLVDFGEYGKGKDRFGFCLYGDASAPGAGYAMVAATAQVPDQAALADCQKVSFWFNLANIRPYGEVVDLFDKVMTRLKEAGWTPSKSVEGYPDTGSSIGDLYDTEDPKFWGKPEADFPREPQAHGYNAADGFVVVVERPGTRPEFTPEEIETIRDLAMEFSRIVFGRELKEVTSRAF
jgi:hypothetical protein